MRTMLRGKVTLLFLAFAVAIFAVAGVAMATTTDTSGTTSASPTISSDKDDYPPGGAVTLTGSGWQPGESVHIVVNDTYGATWKHDVYVTADASGNVTDSFNLPDYFVSDYDVTATGAQSGTATTTFTDGNATVSGRVTDSATSAGISGATVTCTPGCSAITTTDASGDYSFTPTYPGTSGTTLTLTVSASGYTNGTRTVNVPTSGVSVTGQDVALTPSCTNPAAPVFQNTPSASGWYNASTGIPTPNATTSTSGATVTYSLTESGTYSATAPSLGQGQATVYAKAFDSTGNCSTAAVSQLFKVDTNAPTITPADVVDNTWRKTPLGPLSFTASDGGSGLASGQGLDASNGFTLTASAESADADTPTVDTKTVSDKAGNSTTRFVSAKIDLTDPTIGGSASPAANANGWNNTSVTVNFMCGDTPSGVASCGPNVTLSSNGANQSATGTATDNAGRTASDTVSGINIDKNAPLVNCGSPDTDWHGGDVSIACTASDDGPSGLANPADASFNLTTSVPSGTETSNASTGTRTVSDNADNSTLAGAISGIKVDKKKPTFGNCPTGGPFVLGSSQSVTITAGDDGSGLDTANSTLTRSVDTSSLGSTSVTFTAKDNVGNEDTKSCSYNVTYNWNGFFAPVDNPETGKMNSLKAGSAIPLKFSLDGAPVPNSNTGQGLDVVTQKTQGQLIDATNKINCSTGELEPIPTTELLTAGSSTLSYDGGADHYNLVWKTDKAWAGQCRQAVLVTKDGQVHKANFYFSK